MNENNARELMSSSYALVPGSELGTLCYQCKTGINPRKTNVQTAEAVR